MSVSTKGPTDKQSLIRFEKLEQKFYPDWGFRPKTTMIPLAMNFIFINGGMGDYITWLRPIQWLMSQATWIKGGLIVPTYFQEIATYFMKPYPEWKLHDYKALQELTDVNSQAFRGPVELNRESLNATGAHLLTCGWVYFTNKEKAPSPEWDTYPHFEQSDLDAMELPEPAKNLKSKKYVVITTGMTTPSRRVPQGAWNHIIDYVVSKGLTPVFLGKSEMITGNPQNIKTTFDPTVRFDLGIDLRDNTTLMQAASIMSRATVVIGHDNGLLHLAGCTDVPIVFGYNLASPEHREPRRKVGRVYNVNLTSKELACNYCQSNTNFVISFNFQQCFYGDTACLKMLFDNDARRWKVQIDRALADS